ncbi:uncharacterized protein Triagg1_486 [Trichoderma aggressivum f. europaeum]|uniref:Uncharacterized protein n=1 Tax=Trichoderma aggressivum f. europaeum TaxID=173218 RepID=A0AAE1MA68_9HYPO|nr:hypothetical protein Triagg1_486 [Trichoderma aggressivum f. europaeum]
MIRGELVTRYIKDDGTIILAVLPSNVDIATQEILGLAEEYDKNGERTLVVLTKPDLVVEPSAQAAICDLFQSKKRSLNLGYFHVQNRRPNSGLEGRSGVDKIFRKQPWDHLPRDRVGIVALKEQLRSLLVEITRREFPKLIQDVGNQIRECKRELNSLGPPSPDEREQRSFLCSIVGAFQDRVRAALTADYNANSGFDEDEPRLITHMVNMTDTFSADFHESAHSRRFEKLGQVEPSEEVEAPDDCDDKAGLIITLHRFIAAALRSVCSEEQVRSKLWAAMIKSLVERYKKAMDQARLSVEVEQRKQPYTLNKQFAQALSKARGYRVSELLLPKARKDTKQFGGTQFMIHFLAADRFIGNVFQLAFDHCLLREPYNPLKVFTQDWVINLEAEQLEQIVGETRSAKRRGQGYAKKIVDLTNALNILRT